MLETAQSSQPSKPPRSPEMTSKENAAANGVRKKIIRTGGSSRNKDLPPRAPILSSEDKTSSSEPPSNNPQQLNSSEDLSFADFSALQEEDFQEQQTTSLSGYLEDERPSVFRRRKVNAVDVASVGNASDTQISVHNMSGRDLHERAKISFNAGDYTTALPMFESILTAQIRRFTPLHPSVGAAMHNVGVCRQRMGQHALAENLFTEAVTIREQTLGHDHIEVAASLSKLGAAQTALRKYDEAFEKLRKALSIAKNRLGYEHKTVAQMMCHLACLYFEAGELMSSEATFHDALEIYRTVWATAENRDACMTQLTDTLCNVGSIQNRRKCFREAVKSFSEALDLQLGIMPHDDARIISTLDNLGYSYSKLKEYSSALSCYRKMFRAQVSNSGSFTNSCFETFRKEILMFEKLRKYQGAIDEVKETLQMQKSMLPRDHYIIEETKDLLDELKTKLRRASQS